MTEEQIITTLADALREDPKALAAFAQILEQQGCACEACRLARAALQKVKDAAASRAAP